MVDQIVNFEQAVTKTAERLHVALGDGQGQVPAKTLEGAQLIWEHIDGHLRSAIPYPVPRDLLSVSVVAGLRMSKGFSSTGEMFIRRGEFNEQSDFRPWTGFMLVERIILNRYRKTVA